jgi:Bacterial Ig-like domain
VVVDVYSGSDPNGTPVETLTATRSGGSWSVDASPALPDGVYTVVAHQSDLAGNDGASAPRTFTIDTTAPDTTVTEGPSGTVTSTDASFSFSSSETPSTFECRLDAAAWAPCSSPAAYSGLSLGDHTFDVRASDSAGNADATPASRSWTIVSGGAPPPPPPPVSLTLTLTRPKARRLLNHGKLVVRATCDQACTLTLTGKLSLRKGRRMRSYAVRKLVVTLVAGKPTTLKLRLPTKTKRAVLAALRKHRRVTVNLLGFATGPEGTTATKKLKFSAKR